MIAAVTDEDAVVAASVGDARAFTVLYDRHSKTVYNHCFRRTGDWATAEDVTAITFLEAWKRRDRLRLVEGSALPWLLGIATNVVRNAKRSQRRYERLVGRLPSDRNSSDHTDEIAERVTAQEYFKPLLAALRGLPERERVVVELCIGAELSYVEAAAALSCPVGTIKSRLSRGVARLRKSGFAVESGRDRHYE